MSSEVGSTLSTPFVFLRPKNRRDVPPKKALMTATIQSLLKVACRLFKNYGEVKAIYTESGELVQEISQIIPSATYYVTSISPDFSETQDNTAVANSPAKSENPQSPGKIRATTSYNLLFGSGTEFTPEYRQQQEEQIRREEEQRANEEKAEKERQQKLAEKANQERQQQFLKKFTNKKAEERRLTKASRASNAKRESTASESQNKPSVLEDEYDDYYYDDDYNSPIKSQQAGKSTKSSGKRQQLITPDQLRKKNAASKQKSNIPSAQKRASDTTALISTKKPKFSDKPRRQTDAPRLQKNSQASSRQSSTLDPQDYYDDDYYDDDYYDDDYYDDEYYDYVSPKRGQSQPSQKSKVSSGSKNSNTPTRSKMSAGQSPKKGRGSEASQRPGKQTSQNKPPKQRAYSTANVVYDEDEDEILNPREKSSRSPTNKTNRRGSPKRAMTDAYEAPQNDEEDELMVARERGINSPGKSHNRRKSPSKRSSSATNKDSNDDGFESIPSSRNKFDRTPNSKDQYLNQSQKRSSKVNIIDEEEDQFEFEAEKKPAAKGNTDSDEAALARSQEILEMDEMNDQFIFEENGSRTSSLEMLLKEMLNIEEIPQPFVKALKAMKARDRNFIKTTPFLECLQEENWFRLNMNLVRQQLPVDSHISMIELLKTHAIKNIAKHRFAIPGGSSYQIKTAIVGPRHSGKSTFLSIYAESLLCDLVATNMYKKTFVFAVNVLAIRGFCSTFEGLYTTIIDLCIDYLAAQRPLVTEYIPQIRKLFTNVVKTAKSFPSIPISSKLYQDQPLFAQALCKIAKTVWMIFNDETALTQFLTTVFMLPRMFATAAGFSDVLFIIDNFDYASFDINDDTKFTKSNKVFTVEEYWKFSLRNSNFVISCESDDRFYTILEPLIDGGVDLSNGIDFVSTIGMSDDNDDGVVIKVDIEGLKRPFTFTRAHCGGVVAFLHTWEELNEEFTNYEMTEEDSIEKEEMKLMLVSLTQTVIDDLFVNPNPASEEEARQNAILVTGVRRDVH
ncbi:hypothetical protein TVAG_415630 [Trichomonas vaginalis G3]|uniref:Uncharacterized protein n=1 Tax=Trichomonas vaginalis (strain ATCC PRA-98 / G3) TaxID=412133 RepID=A2G2K6_TRIV3|nr:hypothetical protein TVAGG3_0327410 [Trichomonas vaginalis G3]EAX88613.1 hypothetical protein TVAG_415630 [Trichomonas vaginalis G3]KAI5529724.1 hypothetical protein TVAGG3_0327410 [Trichomonas vaginalis G3]|eukprot:XP_001301543.1 hypothetical protein [Trichomonas vaginalis G3]